MRTMRAMRFRLMICLLAAVSIFTGCVTFDPDKFDTQVHEWVPLGTSLAKARRTMEHHAFEVAWIKKNNPFNQLGTDYLDCTRNQVYMHDWSVRFIIRDGKVAEYGAITVD